VTARRDLASRLARSYVLYGYAKRAFYADKDAARRSPHFSEIGARDMALVGDEQIGSVRVQPGPWEARLTDPAAFAAWLTGLYPDRNAVDLAVVTEQVRHQVRESGAWLDEVRGELWDVADIPGLDWVRSGQPWLDIQASPDALATIATHLPVEVRATLAHLDAALRDLDTAPEGSRGECLDEVVTAARFHLDALVAGAILGALDQPATLPAQRAGE
jgi:hypothetical protein